MCWLLKEMNLGSDLSREKLRKKLIVMTTRYHKLLKKSEEGFCEEEVIWISTIQISSKSTDNL